MDHMTFAWVCIFECFLNAVPILSGIQPGRAFQVCLLRIYEQNEKDDKF